MEGDRCCLQPRNHSAGTPVAGDRLLSNGTHFASHPVLSETSCHCGNQGWGKELKSPTPKIRKGEGNPGNKRWGCWASKAIPQTSALQMDSEQEETYSNNYKLSFISQIRGIFHIMISIPRCMPSTRCAHIHLYIYTYS